jgi:hypothetical protein
MRAVGVAALVAAGVVTGCLSLLWLGMPRAGTGNVVAAQASKVLSEYRETAASVWVGARRLHATCYHGWIDAPNGRDHRGTLLRLSNGASILDIPPHRLVVVGSLRPRPVAYLQAAGCTAVLSNRIAGLAEFSLPVRARAARIAGDRVYVVHFPHLTLFVNRRTRVPVAVSNRWTFGTFRIVRIDRSMPS